MAVENVCRPEISEAEGVTLRSAVRFPFRNAQQPSEESTVGTAQPQLCSGRLAWRPESDSRIVPETIVMAKEHDVISNIADDDGMILRQS
ncbi:Neutral Cholesterol Ester Hydrolase 1 [Manis pentadactyla]|nr:Neutral Cholesterol Ester Hydrolase 1 [Manis pentadactyla]